MKGEPSSFLQVIRPFSTVFRSILKFSKSFSISPFTTKLDFTVTSPSISEEELSIVKFLSPIVSFLGLYFAFVDFSVKMRTVFSLHFLKVLKGFPSFVLQVISPYSTDSTSSSKLPVFVTA